MTGVDLIKINVGGVSFVTTRETINREDWLVRRLLEEDEVVLDQDGAVFFDRDPKFFQTILNVLRFPENEVVLPGNCEDPNSGNFRELYQDAQFFQVRPLIDRLNRLSWCKIREEKQQMLSKLEMEKEKLAKELAEKALLVKHGRAVEELKIELQRVKFELDKAGILEKHKRDAILDEVELKSNLLICGVTGTGKSSSLNTLLDSAACLVSGSSGQGTRENCLRDGKLQDNLIVSYIDTQGLGADTSITDMELLERIMISTSSIVKMGVINNILITIDLNARASASVMANQLTLTHLFQELQSSCFLCFTKWNKNDVMAEWNRPLRNWMKKFRSARTLEEITELPPSSQELYRAYTEYLVASMSNNEDGGAFTKMGTFLAFFESRVMFMYNLDPVEVEDKECGCLDPTVELCYEFYRQEALEVLKHGQTRIECSEMPFLKSSKDTLKGIAQDLIKNRDQEILHLEMAGRAPEKREVIRKGFLKMSNQVQDKISTRKYSGTEFIDQLNTASGVVKNVAQLGCMIQ